MNNLIVTRIRQVVAGFFLCATSVIMLSGCDHSSEIKEQKVEAPIESVTADERAVEGSVEVAASKQEDEAKKVKKPLNLHMPVDDSVAVEGTQNFSEKNKLPDLFVGHKEGTKVGGGILRDAENENYAESIQGAEVNVEFQLD